jgi:hypothetical protein
VNKNSDNKDMKPALPSDKPAHNLQDHPQPSCSLLACNYYAMIFLSSKGEEIHFQIKTK